MSNWLPLKKEEAEVFVAVFQWAHRNEIEVTLRHKWLGRYDGGSHPELVFRREDKFVSHAFYDLVHLSDRMLALWERVALELCIEPLKFPLEVEP